MDDLGTEVGELRRLAVADLRDGARALHDAGVAGHDARDVGPDLDLLGLERRADDRGRVVGAAPAEGRGGAARCRGDEALRDGQHTRHPRAGGRRPAGL